MGMIRKRCLRCGDEQVVSSRQRRCHLSRFGRGSYACWGRLERVVETRKERIAVKVDAVSKPKLRPQDAAQKKLEHARKMVTAKTRAMARLATQLRAWERRATYYARRASMTDAEVAADNAARAERQANRPKRRAIKLPDSAYAGGRG